MSPPRLHILYDKIFLIATLNRKIIKNDRKLRIFPFETISLNIFGRFAKKILNEEVAALTVLKRLYLIKVVSRPQKLSGGVKADFVFALLT